MAAEPLSEEERSLRSGAGSYREFVQEREDILRHKWLMSERAGRDVGFEAALLDWVANHRAAARRQMAGKREL